MVRMAALNRAISRQVPVVAVLSPKALQLLPTARPKEQASLDTAAPAAHMELIGTRRVHLPPLHCI